jgi:hypothetical protein
LAAAEELKDSRQISLIIPFKTKLIVKLLIVLVFLVASVASVVLRVNDIFCCYEADLVDDVL